MQSLVFAFGHFSNIHLFKHLQFENCLLLYDHDRSKLFFLTGIIVSIGITYLKYCIFIFPSFSKVVLFSVLTVIQTANFVMLTRP